MLPDDAAAQNADDVDGAILHDAEAGKSLVNVLSQVLSGPDDAEVTLGHHHVLDGNARNRGNDAEKVAHLHVERHKRSLGARGELDEDLFLRQEKRLARDLNL